MKIFRRFQKNSSFQEAQNIGSPQRIMVRPEGSYASLLTRVTLPGRKEPQNLFNIYLPVMGSKEQGFLSFIEVGRMGDYLEGVPFAIKRVYFIYGLNEKMKRGNHAHRTVKQVFFCLQGKATFDCNDGTGQVYIFSNPSPEQGIYVGPMIWMTMEGFSEDTVILALASDYHDEAEYIRDRAEFERLAKIEGGLNP